VGTQRSVGGLRARRYRAERYYAHLAELANSCTLSLNGRWRLSEGSIGNCATPSRQPVPVVTLASRGCDADGFKLRKGLGLELSVVRTQPRPGR
jgi:hypothetical protein